MGKYRFTEKEQTTLEGLQQPLAIYQFLNNQVVTIVLSDGFCELFGYEDRAQAYFDMDHDMFRYVHPDDAEKAEKEVRRFSEEGGSLELVCRIRSGSGSGYKIIHAGGKHIYTENNIRLAHIWFTEEGTYMEDEHQHRSELSRAFEKVLNENSILRENYYDYLTGLPSMTYFFELAEAGRKESVSSGKRMVFLYFDMNGMKFYNNKHGFAAGDRLLKAFADLLIKAFGKENCCHISADHFAVFTEEEGVEEILNRLFDDWREKNREDMLPVRVGIYSNNAEDTNTAIACDRAMLACNSLRKTFVSGFCYFNQELKDDLMKRQYVLENLDRALEEQWIQVYYQPIVRALNGRVCDEEALARWIDPEKGLLSPADFIPYLEEAGMLYKLDLYVLDRILEKFRYLASQGLYVVSQSLNLSRSDFDKCDIVEEIRRRVDDACIDRNRITIEITESIIASDYDFMKEQVKRFQDLGFEVWMDDFGSGYSSLDVLQTIKFNLIKFDMSFMKRLEEGDDGKIILTELMRMTTALGVDTVCEGVETEEQVRFLREIGCSKLQGFYFSKAIPAESILERFKDGTLIPYENPAESAYYEKIGRVNLYDLSVMSYDDASAFHNFFNTIPMAIIEIKDDKACFVQSNRAYREFLQRFLNTSIPGKENDISFCPLGETAGFMKMVQECCQNGTRGFFNETMPDGSVIHAFARHLGDNPISGKTAAAIAILSVTDPDKGTNFANVSRALSSDYYKLYYVDLETEDFIEYRSPVGMDEMTIERHGNLFFEEAKKVIAEGVYKKDQDTMLKSFVRENILRDISELGSYKVSFRAVKDGNIYYCGLKVMRMQNDEKHIIAGIIRIDSPMKKSQAAMELLKDSDTYIRIMALAEDYLSIYIIDPVTGNYRELNATAEFGKLGVAHYGEDFFEQGIIDSYSAIHPDDLQKYQAEFDKEKILSKASKNETHIQYYRLVIDGKTIPVCLKIALVRETDGDRLIAGIKALKG